MATHSTIPAGTVPWTEEPGGLQFMGSPESAMTERTSWSPYIRSGYGEIK